MEIIDDALRWAFRMSLRCEICGKRGVVDCHHYWYRKGFGGGSQLDHPWNLLAACRHCHDKHHNEGKPTRQQLLELVARREGVTEDAIKAELLRLRNAPKRQTDPTGPL